MKFLYSVEYYDAKGKHLHSFGLRAETLHVACDVVKQRTKPRGATVAKITSAGGNEYAEVQI